MEPSSSSKSIPNRVRGEVQDQPFLQDGAGNQVLQSSDAPLKRSLTMVEPVYEIRVAGAVPETDLRDMESSVAPDQVNTILYGITDQAALYGLLARLEALGVEVIEVRRVSAPTCAHCRASTRHRAGERRRLSARPHLIRHG